MDDLTHIRIRANMNILFWKIKYSLEDIENKHPHRHDLIKSMTESQQWLGEAILFMHELERLQIAKSKEIYRLEIENMQLKLRIKNLEIVNTKLFENATL